MFLKSCSLPCKGTTCQVEQTIKQHQHPSTSSTHTSHTEERHVMSHSMSHPTPAHAPSPHQQKPKLAHHPQVTCHIPFIKKHPSVSSCPDFLRPLPPLRLTQMNVDVCSQFCSSVKHFPTELAEEGVSSLPGRIVVFSEV